MEKLKTLYRPLNKRSVVKRRLLKDMELTFELPTRDRKYREHIKMIPKGSLVAIWCEPEVKPGVTRFSRYCTIWTIDGEHQYTVSMSRNVVEVKTKGRSIANVGPASY